MRRSVVTLVAVACLTLAAGCTAGDGRDTANPTERLQTAKQAIDDAASVEFELETDRLPDGIDGVTRASGTGNHDPAFKGTIDVVAQGFSGEAPVVAVDSEVYVKLPFTSEYVAVDPEAYGAPDPAALMSTDSGFSSLLTAAEEVSESGERRDGEEVLTELTGTLDGATVAPLFPTAEESGRFDVAFTLTDDDKLVTATVTGPFYSGAGDVTYDIAIDTSDEPVDITKP